ncbi:protein-tyrosine-phosphatase [Reichenbachiella agarivorans]|uniref:Protein-tyrosine-phosphatase n=1 Tax=Reichenbachiella agarivorans TaxID=2979464 RepID=A0ABY6CMD6_9BACT|nr:protein-tyrosine-phosphatase [Reichenbachiella agarivorans]UXP30899.1 protein-tyrosine-phosphatase [Reichenbachiella agarivorans]
MLSGLSKTIDKVRGLSISAERKEVLKVLIDYVQSKVDAGQEVNLNFICTHNSRRSQFSQIWAQTAADFFGVPAHCYSGGVEVTAFNERAVDSIKRSGFGVAATGEINPVYQVLHSEDAQAIQAFSKLFDDPINQAAQFAAVMTCSHADDNCPFIPGTEQRIPVRYEDPKAFDDTPQEAEKYDERSMQIASEMFYVFSEIKLPS